MLISSRDAKSCVFTNLFLMFMVVMATILMMIVFVFAIMVVIMAMMMLMVVMRMSVVMIMRMHQKACEGYSYAQKYSNHFFSVELMMIGRTGLEEYSSRDM